MRSSDSPNWAAILRGFGIVALIAVIVLLVVTSLSPTIGEVYSCAGPAMVRLDGMAVILNGNEPLESYQVEVIEPEGSIIKFSCYGDELFDRSVSIYPLELLDQNNIFPDCDLVGSRSSSPGFQIWGFHPEEATVTIVRNGQTDTQSFSLHYIQVGSEGCQDLGYQAIVEMQLP